jgi:hypothetical protein
VRQARQALCTPARWGRPVRWTPGSPGLSAECGAVSGDRGAVTDLDHADVGRQPMAGTERDGPCPPIDPTLVSGWKSPSVGDGNRVGVRSWADRRGSAGTSL